MEFHKMFYLFLFHLFVKQKLFLSLYWLNDVMEIKTTIHYLEEKLKLLIEKKLESSFQP